jgi:hypothetical protein
VTAIKYALHDAEGNDGDGRRFRIAFDYARERDSYEALQ